MKYDWKFLITTAVAVVSILLSLWIWRSDAAGRSISARVDPVVSLQPKAATTIPDLKVFIGGTEIANPSLVTAKIFNSGDRPIPSGDFESPIQIDIGKEAKIVRATVERSTPENLKVEMSFSETRIQISPLLLNPGDTISFSIITSGKSPELKFSARISGISEIIVEVPAKKSADIKSIILLSSLSVLCIFLALIFMDQAIFNKPVHISRPLAAGVFVMSCLLGGGVAGAIGDYFEAGNWLASYWAVVGMSFIAAVALQYFFSKNNPKEESNVGG